MTIPERETQYVRTPDGAFVGFQVFGSGPLDILFVPDWAQNLDVMWEEPSIARYLDRLATFARVICVDKRGSGVSEPVSIDEDMTFDLWLDDFIAVLDHVGSTRAAVIADTEGGPVSILFTATFPDRVSSLVLINSFARFRRAADYPVGMPDERFEGLIELAASMWGQDENLIILGAPSRASDVRFRKWAIRYSRLCMSPGHLARFYRWGLNVDVRGVLDAIRPPTLVIHRSGNTHHRVGHGRYLAEHIPGAAYLELEGADSQPFNAGDTTDILDAVEEFLTGATIVHNSDRMLATILFTDIVGSTDRAATVGDQQWLDELEVHNRVTAEHIERYRGILRDTTGDGVLATFDGPARAVTCAIRVQQALERLGIQTRVGVHTGEIEVRDGEIGGIGIHIASRVMSQAEDGSVAASSTVRDLVVGAGFEFTSIGKHDLKGVPGSWELFDVETQQ